MPRSIPLYSDFYYRPLVEDIEELLARFQHADTVRYEVFSAIWREMKLPDVFFGIGRASDTKRFAMTALATSMKYFLPPFSYQIRVGGLYLMFGFYHTQLAFPKVQIRLTLRDWPSVESFLKDSADSGHLDVIYIYQKLVGAKAIHYTAMPHHLTFRKQKAPAKKPPVCAEFLGRTTAVQDYLSPEFMEELSNTHSRYEKLKLDTGVGSEVSMVHGTLAASMNDTLLEFLRWQRKVFPQPGKADDSDEEEDKMKLSRAESSSRARLLSSIKQKSFKGVQETSKSRRHRQNQLAESSGSGVEQNQEAEPRRSRPLSLRARTCQSFGMTDVKRESQAWLLSAPEKWKRLPGRTRGWSLRSSPPQEQSSTI